MRLIDQRGNEDVGSLRADEALCIFTRNKQILWRQSSMYSSSGQLFSMLSSVSKKASSVLVMLVWRSKSEKGLTR